MTKYSNNWDSGQILSGTSFPGSPATNSLFFRTDLGKMYFYNGTYWLGIVEHRVSASVKTPQSATGYVEYYTVRIDIDNYFTYAIFRSYVLTTNNASNYWKLKFVHFKSPTYTVLTEVSTAADTPGTWNNHDSIFTTPIMDDPDFIVFSVEKVGSPGNLYYDNNFFYRERG